MIAEEEQQQQQLEQEQQEQTIEYDNQDMMQVNFDALQSETTDADAADASNQSPQPLPISHESNDDGNELNVPATDPTEASSDSSSLPAIAEEMPNGCSQETKVSNELDAEMVSEDELPAPAQPIEIDDAEDLSDEELPAPKRAELPADTEVVSEDELPSSNKVKRKAEEIQETSSTTETVDTPKKRAKTELESKHPIFIL